MAIFGEIAGWLLGLTLFWLMLNRSNYGAVRWVRWAGWIVFFLFILYKALE